MGTLFSKIYNRFLEKITDDMYIELTPEDTLKDLQRLLINSIPGFEFPRKNLYDYEIKTEKKLEDEISEDDFVIGVLWEELGEDSLDEIKTEKKLEDETSEDDFVIGMLWEKMGEDSLEFHKVPYVVIDKSSFSEELTPEEINILALLMKQMWVQRQVTSIENTRMKYSGADFKMTSQANHLAKLLSLLDESRRDSFHMQRLYKRRKLDKNGIYQSEWHTLRRGRRNERE